MTKKIIKPKTTQKSIRFPDPLIEKVEKLSYEQRRSFGASIIKIVEDYLNSNTANN